MRGRGRYEPLSKHQMGLEREQDSRHRGRGRPKEHKRTTRPAAIPTVEATDLLVPQRTLLQAAR